MPIITISRGSYSRGKDVAEKLARRLGYECLSRDVLLEASDEFNIPEIKLVRALHDAPTVLERFRHGKERYVAYIRSALLRHMLKNNIVYHGLAGHYFLQDISHVLKVRILANLDDRVKEEMCRENILAEEARYILKKDDEERHKWGIKVYGVDTKDNNLYDMVLHIDTITVEDAVDILCQVVQKPAFQMTSESRERIENMALAATVEACIIHLAPTVKVTALNGVVSIGNLDQKATVGKDTAQKIKTIAEKVAGVKKVQLYLISIKEESGRINPFYNM